MIDIEQLLIKKYSKASPILVKYFNPELAIEAFVEFLKERQQQFITEAEKLDAISQKVKTQEARNDYAYCRLQQDVLDFIIEDLTTNRKKYVGEGIIIGTVDKIDGNTLIDYKTGSGSTSTQRQLNLYKKILEKNGIKINGIFVYNPVTEKMLSVNEEPKPEASDWVI
jgi:hypothetical protein